ncbi:hypothetical protein Q1695_014409 [Nippostrongylus brasiliensis]|nr:hypothetical protein Q1695_014409 [Nippostrongylus brasiliensis]
MVENVQSIRINQKRQVEGQLERKRKVEKIGREHTFESLGKKYKVERHRRRRHLTENELIQLADESRERQAFREFLAMVFCHGMSKNAIRRAKNRTDFYYAIKAFMLYLEVIAVLLVCCMAIGVVQYINREEADSAYYTTQLIVELVMLVAILLVVLFEDAVYRYIVVLALLSAFFLNLIQILYFLLYDKVVVDCERSKPFFGAISCALMHSAAHNMSAFAALFLALLHLAGFAAAMMLNFYYLGTIDHLMQLAKAVGFSACLTYMEQRKAKAKERRRRRRLRRKREQEEAIGRNVDPKKFPVGTKISTERTTTYKFKGRVQPGGIVIGSGQEISNDAVTVQAPNQEAAKRETKTVRHVMIDGVRRKQQIQTFPANQPQQPAKVGASAEKPQGKNQQLKAFAGSSLESGTMEGSTKSSGGKFNAMEAQSSQK